LEEIDAGLACFFTVFVTVPFESVFEPDVTRLSASLSKSIFWCHLEKQEVPSLFDDNLHRITLQTEHP
jgi:hypothetical protein